MSDTEYRTFERSTSVVGIYPLTIYVEKIEIHRSLQTSLEMLRFRYRDNRVTTFSKKKKKEKKKRKRRPTIAIEQVSSPVRAPSRNYLHSCARTFLRGVRKHEHAFSCTRACTRAAEALFTAAITRDVERQAGLITVTDTAVLNWQRCIGSVTYLLMASNDQFHTADSQD